MGVSFKKDLVVDRVQVFPKGQDDKNNKLQVIHMKIIYKQLPYQASKKSLYTTSSNIYYFIGQIDTKTWRS